MAYSKGLPNAFVSREEKQNIFRKDESFQNLMKIKTKINTTFTANPVT
jgi:hypothetical protein